MMLYQVVQFLRSKPQGQTRFDGAAKITTLYGGQYCEAAIEKHQGGSDLCLDSGRTYTFV